MSVVPFRPPQRYRPPRIFEHIPWWMVPFFAATLPIWREFAIRRHRQYNHEEENDDPVAMAVHMKMIAWEFGW